MKIIAYALAAIIALPLALVIIALFVSLFGVIWALGFPITLTNVKTKQKIGYIRWFKFVPAQRVTQFKKP